ncbi:MAG: type II toxin-antitoxin system prevent-host-death family antitoxin [Pontixanthobacter sp.]
MTIHVNIGEAKTRLSELIAAALRGEEVILNKAGRPVVRLVPEMDAVQLAKEALREQRNAWIGSMAGQFSEEALDYAAEPAFTDEEFDEIENAPLSRE